jgi:low molecular weight protein-tyrosine phosphatase
VKAPGKRLHVSFVCTGNICRSPVAAIVFREHVRRAGLDVEVSSAGIGGWHVGDAADERAVRSLVDAGYSAEHVAAQVGESHLRADLLVALDSGHARELRRLVGGVGGSERVRLLRSFDPDADGVDVPDPYYGDREGFDVVLAMTEAAVPGLLGWVREQM